MRTTGQLVRERRVLLGIDQRDLSQISGVSIHTISDIEAGKGNPTVATLSRILDALGMELHVRIKE
ncbi:helix-turn-helix domain-containing protein [Verrucomicrobiota bacterium]